MQSDGFHLLVNDAYHRVVEENIPKLLRCLHALNDHQINHQFNPHALSVAQSIVHLNGNVRQWIFQHLLGQTFKRNRKQEFEHKNANSKALENMLLSLGGDLKKAIPELTKLAPNQAFTIQGMKNTSVSVLVHVTEHFSYHTGQVVLLCKLLEPKDLGFYNHLKGINDA